jgi:hypothetical protein
MTLYWIYDLHNFALCALILGTFLVVSLLGLVLTRPIVRRLLDNSGKHNDIVSYFFAGIGVFYGLALGLIAVATWESYSQVDGVVSTEAAAVASLYRDLDGYPQPLRGDAERMLREYTRTVIDKEWPAHKQGVALEDGDVSLDKLENAVMAFEPKTERDKIIHAAVIRSLDTVVDQRRLRLEAVGTGLPIALWSVVLFGAILNIALSYLFWVDNFKLHALLVGMMVVFIGLLVFLTAAMDNPFRGEVSISPDAFEDTFKHVMNTEAMPGADGVVPTRMSDSTLEDGVEKR